MTVKQFFKSTAFKCIAALLGILLVCGVLLTFAYSFLEVSASEKADRAVAKIYGGIDVERGAELIKDGDEKPSTNLYTILQGYEVTYQKDGSDVKNYLVQSRGKKGFSSGSVTCWVAVIVENGKIAGIENVTIDSNVNQSFIGNITADFLGSFGKNYEDGIEYTADDGFVVSGTSMSSAAIRNAVNGALEYVSSILGEANA